MVWMLCSGNDAANVIAEYISGSTDKFAELMNKEAQALCKQSHFRIGMVYQMITTIRLFMICI